MRIHRSMTHVGCFALVAAALAACQSRPSTNDPQRAAAVETLAPGQAPAMNLPQLDPPDAGPMPPPPIALAVPTTIRGELTAGDMRMPPVMQPEFNGPPRPVPTAAVCDNYVLDLVAGHPVTIVARAERVTPWDEPLDTYLYLYRERDPVAFDDDSARQGDLANSRIVFTPETTGRYVLRVTSYGTGFHSGPYTLQTFDGALPNQL
jgi:hypothetical protein